MVDINLIEQSEIIDKMEEYAVVVTDDEEEEYCLQIGEDLFVNVHRNGTLDLDGLNIEKMTPINNDASLVKMQMRFRQAPYTVYVKDENLGSRTCPLCRLDPCLFFRHALDLTPISPEDKRFIMYWGNDPKYKKMFGSGGTYSLIRNLRDEMSNLFDGDYDNIPECLKKAMETIWWEIIIGPIYHIANTEKLNRRFFRAHNIAQETSDSEESEDEERKNRMKRAKQLYAKFDDYFGRKKRDRQNENKNDNL